VSKKKFPARANQYLLVNYSVIETICIAQMRREELASRSSSSRFVVCDAAVGGATSTRRAVINTSADRSTLSSLGCMRKTAEMSCVKPGTAELGLGHGTAAAVHDDDDETDACRTTTRLRHSFSDSDLHKFVTYFSAFG